VEKYVIIALVLLCVGLGVYAAGLQRRLAKEKENVRRLKTQKELLKHDLDHKELFFGLMETRHSERAREITVLTQQLRIANIRLARVRNRLRTK